ncbi:MAG: S1C family serine protease [Clostridia bacterium]|nr:S1C family serine protease [Clostridia bacterium]
MKLKKRQLFAISAILVFVLLCTFLVACDAKDGTDGKDGKSAYELAVEQGFEGTLDEWLASLKGSAGSDGKDGVDGANGIDGAVDVNELFNKAKKEGFQGDFIEFLNAYLTLNADCQVASNLALLSAVKVYVSDYYNYWGQNKEISAMGSGVIYKLNKEAGSAYIITNYHVVYNGNLTNVGGIYSNIKVYLYGYESESQAITAKYIAGAYDYDIAILKVEDSDIIKNSSARAVNVASSKDIVAGSTVLAVGNPATGTGLANDIKISVTQGVVSVDSENVSVGDSQTKYSVSTRVMRVDAAINSGNSGGGLYNAKGQLVGIVNAKATSSSIENMGYAIPSDVVVGIADYAIANCDGEDNRYVKKLYLGIGGSVNSSKAVYDASSKTVKLIEEISVGEVSDDSVVSGLLQEGDILKAVEFDGIKYEITRSYSLPDALWNAKAGKTNSLKFYIVRDGADKTVNVAISATNFNSLK